MSAVAGSWTGACIRQSDWTRFAKTRYAPTLHQVVTGPITLVICTTMGVAATSAVAHMYGSAIWVSFLSFFIYFASCPSFLSSLLSPH
jgi:nucleobase:cation symporter-1, NCS1 family